MKKRITTILCLALILAMAGCGNHGAATKPVSNQPAGVKDVLEQGMAEADNNKADNSSQPAENDTQNRQNTENPETQTPEQSIPADSADRVDVDLTVLSSIMVYSEVYNMMASPEAYIGKTVKMKGLFAYYHDEATGNYFFACIIQDATACCAQGIEFVLAGEHLFPDDYPEPGAEICVTGVFDTYQESENSYCTLRNAKLL